MTDILDEILAYAAESQHPSKPPPQPNPRVSLPPPDLSTSFHLHPPFAPSPRGIQDDLSAFSLLRPAPSPYPNHPPPKPELVPLYNPPPDSPPHSPPSHLNPCIPHTTSSTSDQSSLVVSACPTPSVNQHSLSPPLGYHGAGVSADHVTADLFSLPQGGGGGGSKRAAFACGGGAAAVVVEGNGGGVVEGRVRKGKGAQAEGATTVVMPPSAKSILERREKAIREGRRKDAKLTETERRILRRLRNRESAERCRLRRVQQAAMLEKKIETMQVENKRLVEQAEEYQRTIQRLERVIREFSSAQDKVV